MNKLLLSRFKAVSSPKAKKGSKANDFYKNRLLAKKEQFEKQLENQQRISILTTKFLVQQASQFIDNYLQELYEYSHLKANDIYIQMNYNKPQENQNRQPHQKKETKNHDKKHDKKDNHKDNKKDNNKDKHVNHVPHVTHVTHVKTPITRTPKSVKTGTSSKQSPPKSKVGSKAMSKQKKKTVQKVLELSFQQDEEKESHEEQGQATMVSPKFKTEVDESKHQSSILEDIIILKKTLTKHEDNTKQPKKSSKVGRNQEAKRNQESSRNQDPIETQLKYKLEKIKRLKDELVRLEMETQQLGRQRTEGSRAKTPKNLVCSTEFSPISSRAMTTRNHRAVTASNTPQRRKVRLL